jgi:hypothetical protein
MDKELQIMFIDALSEKWDSYHDDRQEFYRQIREDCGILVTEQVPGDLRPDVIFVHQSFLFQSNLMDTNSQRHSSVADALFVFYGNNGQSQLEIGDKEVSYFNFYILQTNFRGFLEEVIVEGLQRRSWESLFGFDPELERLLEPFSTLSPFESSLPWATDEFGGVKTVREENGTEVRQTIKDELSAYVTSRLKEK